MCAVVILAAFFAGCKEEITAPPRPVQKRAERKAVKPVPGAEKKDQEVVQTYRYDPAGKRDPFLPYIASVPVGAEKGEPEVPLTELQQYELSQLKLVAIMKFKDRSVAMVEDPTGKGHTIKIGTLVGKHGGKVVSIEKDRVLVEEKERDLLGGITAKIQEIVIETPEGGR